MTDEIGRINARSERSPESRPRRRKMIGEDGQEQQENHHASRCGRAVSAWNGPERSRNWPWCKNAMSPTTGSRKEWLHRASPESPMVIDALRRRSAACVAWPASSGRTLGNGWQYPASDGTSDRPKSSAKFYRRDTLDIAFKVPLVTTNTSSKKIALPWELVQTP